MLILISPSSGPITAITPTISASSLLVTTLARQGEKSATHSLLDLSDGSHLQTIQGGTNVQYRCQSILSKDDGTIMAGDEQGKIRAWDVLSGKERPFTNNATSAEHTNAVLWLETTDKNGGRIVSASADGSVKVWARP